MYGQDYCFGKGFMLEKDFTIFNIRKIASFHNEQNNKVIYIHFLSNYGIYDTVLATSIDLRLF